MRNLFDQFTALGQFSKLASFVLFFDMMLLFSGSAPELNSGEFDFSNISVRDIVAFFFVVVMIRVFWTIIIFPPFVIILIWCFFEENFFDPEADNNGIWIFCWNAPAFTTIEEEQNLCFSSSLLLASSFYYAVLSILSTDLAVYDVASFLAGRYVVIFGDDGDELLISYMIVFVTCFFLLCAGFGAVMRNFHYIGARKVKDNTDALRRETDSNRQAALVEIGVNRNKIELLQNQISEERLNYDKRIFFLELIKHRKFKSKRKK